MFIFNPHYDLKGKHAFLSPSVYHWINYDKEKLGASYFNAQKKEEGTKLHALASELISRSIKVAKLKRAFNLFVNDSISEGMSSEVTLYYSQYCFGTADAISFEDGVLKVFDLKTGESRASFIQLDIYSALFCLEYGIDPNDIQFVERIYQYNTHTETNPTSEYISSVMSAIVEKDEWLTELDI